ncbi:MAG: UvrD-helicase domain-containing protein [Paludibacteraceae bacterium]|nr:UvrD-helicase domain-containing protein [Paludibacteraceae bacterium]
MKTSWKELEPMTVYKASAGSGKTFTLAAQYISIVMYEALTRGNYKAFEHIVAMTFTVKATKEMKDRILSYLYDLSQGRNDKSFMGFKQKLSELLLLQYDKMHNNQDRNIYNHKAGKTDSDIVVKTDIMAEETQEKVRMCAREILKAILNNYARFNVTTIDSFFQSVLQGVLYELGMPAEQQLLLDETDIHNKSVDRMVNNLCDDAEGRAILNPILDFAKDSLEENKSGWDIRKELKKAANKLGEEVYKFHAEAIEKESGDGKYDELRKRLYAKRAEIRSEVEIRCGSMMQRALEKKAGSKSPISVIGTAARDMQKLVWKGPNKTIQKVLDGEISGDGIYHDFIDLYKLYVDKSRLLNTIQIVLPHLYTITLLTNIERNMRDIQRENMQMLLSSANMLLRDLLSGDARSFVYSKVGPRLEHLLIDEFQDTSQMQWNNLEPLVEELRSEDKHSVIVGDIKQSIYRFRNGKWKLLSDVADRDGFVSLSDNFRSTRAVVETNNELFPRLASEMDGILEENGYGSNYLSPVYEKNVEVHQNVNKEGGNVRFYMYSKKGGEEAEERLRIDFCEQIKAIRRQISESGKSGSIAILVRTKDEGERVLEWLQGDEELRGVSVETEDSYQLGASETLQVLVAMLRYVEEGDKCKREKSIYGQYIEDVLGEEVRNELEDSREYWLSHPLYEMNDRLIKHFGLGQRGENEYVEKYLSCLKAYLMSEISTAYNLKSLLEKWDTVMCELKVNKTPDKDALTLMTIHKSKGLAFDYVLVPLFDSTMNKEIRSKTTLLWDTQTLADDEDGLKDMLQTVSVLSVSSERGKTSQSLWSEPYKEEVRLRFMDALNSVYVAFTRAKEAYYCWCAYSPEPKTTDTDSIGTPMLKALSRIGMEKEEREGGEIVFTSERELVEVVKEKESYVERLNITDNAKRHPIVAPMYTGEETLPIEIVNSNKALQLFRDVQNDTEEIWEQKNYIESGLIYHSLFENLMTLNDEDVQKAIDKYRLNNELDARHEMTFRRFVEAARSHKVLQEVFSKDAQTLTEASFIVTTEEGVETLRPDRVVLTGGRAIVTDYKFSSYKNLMLNDEKHTEQRRKYYEQLTKYVEMTQRFYKIPAEGWLWFLRDNELINVTKLNK